MIYGLFLNWAFWVRWMHPTYLDPQVPLSWVSLGPTCWYLHSIEGTPCILFLGFRVEGLWLRVYRGLTTINAKPKFLEPECFTNFNWKPRSPHSRRMPLHRESGTVTRKTLNPNQYVGNRHSAVLPSGCYTAVVTPICCSGFEVRV